MWKLTVKESLSLLGFLVLFVLGVIYVASGEFGEHFDAVTNYVRANQTEGVFIFIGAIAVACFIPSPVFLMIFSAGFCFESFWLAVLSCYVGTLLGASLSFVLSRWLLRELVERYVISGYKLFSAMDTVIQKKGILLVTVLRLPYMPMTKMCYLLSCTSVSYRDYITGTALGIIPAIFTLILIGQGFQAAEDTSELPTWLFIPATIFIVGVIVFVAWYANRMLEAEIGKENDRMSEQGDTEREPFLSARRHSADHGHGSARRGSADRGSARRHSADHHAFPKHGSGLGSARSSIAEP